MFRPDFIKFSLFNPLHHMAVCCPPGSTPYLEATYAAQGSVVTLGAVDIYAAPAPVGSPSTKGLLLCPDVWGWNGGRVRAIADALAGEGYIVVVPKLLTPCMGEGTDGDALPPDGAFSMDWIKNFPWTAQKAKVDAALAYLRSQGATKIGVMGFCYGGHPSCWASAENTDVVAGVVLHPSMQLETFAFGGDCAALLKSVQCPFLLAPAGNDMPMWAEEGDFCQALKASTRGAELVVKPFPEMTHGWSVRGDVGDVTIKRDVELVLADTKAFFAEHMAE